MIRLALTLTLILLTLPSPAHADITGKPRVIDGDTIQINQTKIRLHGIDAPETKQTCRTSKGKIERWHQTLKNRVLLENYYLPGDLEMQIGAFVDHYNNHRYHESLANVTPADTYFGRDTAIIERRKMIKKLTIQKRRLNHQRQAA